MKEERVIEAAVLDEFYELKELLEEGANPNAQNERGEGALFWAVQNENHEMIELLLDYKVNLDLKNEIGETALFWAVENEDVVAAKLLIEAGADVNIKNIEGESCIELAFFGSLKHKEELVDLLKNAGALYDKAEFEKADSLNEPLNKEDFEDDEMLENQEHPIFYELNSESYLEKLKQYLDEGGDPNILDEEGESLLHWAVENGLLIAASLLIHAGANVNVKDEHGVSPLMLAFHWNLEEEYELEELLIKKGADINAKDAYGNSVLYWAVENDHLIGSKILLDLGADINASNESGATALHLAVEHEELDIIELLMLYKANPHQKDDYGRTPLDLALECDEEFREEILDILNSRV